ncbi:nucleotide excision repair endonuclease [Rhodohalobacter sp.]|uniref:nucleotide excision repair endonuclease n=1 Tax=Rhodohalobacter sp. TaxID=1974210 RepID=UPI002ACD5782|nr:nucleotide excision repair endonuclease [Rhodohalobacter sp.]MDZ7756778.1 nucleotide excision repair endonuclease [Rhodohalobacter sp.]
MKSNSLFPSRSLLEERLGAERFDSIPTSPGVYRFYDGAGDLLYVGKAKNLRRRLFTYKRAKAGQVSRKVAEMIGRIDSMVWVETESEREALLLENRMIRGARPPYNHANKEPETYYFIYIKPDEAGVEFRLAMRIHEETDQRFWHGCFKGHATVRRSLGCLLRLLWMAEHNVKNPMHLPVQLTRNLTPMRYTLSLNLTAFKCKEDPVRAGGEDVDKARRCQNPESPPGVLTGLIDSWIRGESCEILDWLIVQIECGERLAPFQVRFLESHLDILKTFYDRKLVPHRKLRGESRHIKQEELDDLLVT